MRDEECIEFLQWALPQLGLHWRGFRAVRRQVCRRVQQRIRVLGLPDTSSYRSRLMQEPDEWRALGNCCVVTISRFYRDRGVYDALRRTVLPALAISRRATPERRLRVWSAGCASGEEPYSVALLWHLELAARFPELMLELIATDNQPDLLERARRGCYRHSTLRELPSGWVAEAFERSGDQWCVRQRYREGVQFVRRDVTDDPPDGAFDMVLCRNLVFTYFTPERQAAFLRALVPHLASGAALVVGSHESLPGRMDGLTPWKGAPCVWRCDPEASAFRVPCASGG